MAKTPGRKSSPAESASRHSPRTSPRNSMNSDKQADTEKSKHVGGKRPPEPLKDYAVGQVIHVPSLRRYLEDHPGVVDVKDDEEETKIGPAIIAAICNDCMLVLPILHKRQPKGPIAFDVVDLNVTPEPGRGGMEAALAGEVLAVRGHWRPEPTAYVRINFVVTVDFDEENWGTLGVSVLDELIDVSTAWLGRRTSFVMGKMIHMSPSLQNDALLEHAQDPSHITRSVDWHKGYAAAKNDSARDGEDDNESEDNDHEVSFLCPLRKHLLQLCARDIRHCSALTTTQRSKGKRSAAKSTKHPAEANERPAAKGTKRPAPDSNDPTATKKRVGTKGTTQNAKGAAEGGSTKTTATEDKQEKKPKPKKTNVELTEVYKRTSKPPNGNYTCQHEHDKTKCACKCCKEGTKHPHTGFLRWKKEQEAIANGSFPKGLARVKHSSKKIKSLPQKIPKGLVDDESGEEDSGQEGGEGNDSDRPLAEVARLKGKSEASPEKGSGGGRVNDVPRKAASSSSSKTGSSRSSRGSTGSRRPSKASKKNSLTSTASAPAGGVKKTAATSTRKSSDGSNGSTRSTRSRQFSAAAAATTDVADGPAEDAASEESVSEEE